MSRGTPEQAGTFAPPPAEAPHEVTSGAVALDQQAIAAAQARRADAQAAKGIDAPAEATLAPLAAPTRPPLTGSALIQSVGLRKAIAIAGGDAALEAQVQAETGGSAAGTTAPPRPPITAASEAPAPDDPTSATAGEAATAALTALPDVSPDTHPAMSNTDSPTRGQPQPIADPGKQITGAFGSPEDAQYFPLDGVELKELIRGLLSAIDAGLDDDLRFSLAVTYPRVRARVEVLIEADGMTEDADHVRIPRVLPPRAPGQPGATPLEVARSRGEEIVFVIAQQRQEVDAAGESASPPDAIRAELGLTGPRKQSVATPTGRQLVDLPS